MSIVIGIIVLIIAVALSSLLKNKNEEINDIYPFTDKGDLK